MLDAAAAAARTLVEGITPIDALGAQHKSEALHWLARTPDIYRRVKPATPSPRPKHTDVSLWFALVGRPQQDLVIDEGEFVQVRWWNAADLRAADPARFEPHLVRALDASEDRWRSQ